MEGKGSGWEPAGLQKVRQAPKQETPCKTPLSRVTAKCSFPHALSRSQAAR